MAAKNKRGNIQVFQSNLNYAGRRIYEDGWIYVVDHSLRTARPACKVVRFEKLIMQAKDEAQKDTDRVRDLAAEHGQQLDNVRHTTWFVETLARDIASTTKTWADVLPAFQIPT